ncbi:phage tailspike protein [Escherichia coli]|uniref:phage tailspike protein n=1 Tax=Escherichia coli TaxID=562 RepID=UPI002245D42D|nr:phage tailspike protein [Escherichia coli]MCX0092168.1 phage tailspike protein [Escherichia coli]
MSDITANVVVSMPSQLFTMARSFKAVANGEIYIGKIDTDPVNPENQIQVYMENEDGSHVPVAQPIIINAAGYPVYNGQIAKFVTVQGHSMAVYDAYGAQQFYFPNVLKYDPDQLRADLESENGAYFIKHRDTTVGNEIDILNNYLVSVNVKDFGAIGDWNEKTQKGSDDTSFFQNAINAICNIPTIYNGGVREIYVPPGNYRVKQLVIPSSLGFGLQIRGAGSINTRIYSTPDTYGESCIFSNVGYIIITDIELLGSLKRNADISERSYSLLEVKPSDGSADCDVRINSTAHLGGAETIVKLHGRGFHCAGGLLFFSGTALEIVCDVSSWGSGNNTAETGMRNYHISDTRFDTVGVGIRVTGSGVEKDFINDVSFINNDIFQMDRAFIGSDCTIQHSLFSGNTSIASFAYGFVESKRIVDSTISNNILRNFYNRSFLPSEDNQYMHGIVICSGSAERLLVTGNTTLYNTLHVVKVGAESDSVTISNNIFEQSYLSGATALIFRGANCQRLSITGNTFHNATSPSITVDAFDVSKQTSPTTLFEGNSSSFNINSTHVTYQPILKYGSNNINLSAYSGKYNVLGNRVIVNCQIATTDISTGASSDEIVVSVPLNPVSDSVITNSFSGAGKINFSNGGVPPLIRAQVISNSGVIFVKSDGTSLKRGDLKGTYGIIFCVEYKI